MSRLCRAVPYLSVTRVESPVLKIKKCIWPEKLSFHWTQNEIQHLIPATMHKNALAKQSTFLKLMVLCWRPPFLFNNLSFTVRSELLRIFHKNNHKKMSLPLLVLFGLLTCLEYLCSTMHILFFLVISEFCPNIRYFPHKSKNLWDAGLNQTKSLVQLHGDFTESELKNVYIQAIEVYSQFITWQLSNQSFSAFAIVKSLKK